MNPDNNLQILHDELDVVCRLTGEVLMEKDTDTQWQEVSCLLTT